MGGKLGGGEISVMLRTKVREQRIEKGLIARKGEESNVMDGLSNGPTEKGYATNAGRYISLKTENVLFITV